GEGTSAFVANAGPYEQCGVAAMSISGVTPVSESPATVIRTRRGFELRNEHLSVQLDEAGLVSSLVVRVTGREAIAPGQKGNLLQLHRDTPTRWDAWDIDEHYRRHVIDL